MSFLLPGKTGSRFTQSARGRCLMQTPDPTPEEFADRLAEIQATEAFQKRQKPPEPQYWLPPVIALAVVQSEEQCDE